MSQPVIVSAMFEADWKALGAELYGEDVMDWQFACPACHTMLSFNSQLDNREKLKGWQPYSECVGRYLPKQGCDWAAYGLFSGPRTVESDGKKIPVFYFAKEDPKCHGKKKA